MERLIINGGRTINGKTELQGSKNSTLPILAATLAVNGTSVIHNCPDLTDISAAIKILEHIGCKVKREDRSVIVDSSSASRAEIPESMMREMRSSIVFLGALISRFGYAQVSAPGGCEIGLRPIDLHLSSLERMGVRIEENGGVLRCDAGSGTNGCEISLVFPSVGATENIILAAAGAKGETVITNAAREPEIKDLADFLVRCGAKISGAGESVVRICGTPNLTGSEHTVIPDRIIASTFMACAACSGGEVAVSGVEKDHILHIISAFEAADCKVSVKNGELFIKSPKRISRIKSLRTMPYPGFPTDSQAIIMAALSTAKGTSVITEKIFENRFRHVPELIKMGADIRVEDGCVAVVDGVEKLCGAKVSASDLRGGCALAVAALGAEGTTVIENIYHIDRGFEEIEKHFSYLGADIRRIRN